MNIWDIVIIAAVAVCVLLAIRNIRKKGGSCSCGCENCRKKCSR